MNERAEVPLTMTKKLLFMRLGKFVAVVVVVYLNYSGFFSALLFACFIVSEKLTRVQSSSLSVDQVSLDLLSTHKYSSFLV